MVIKKGHIVGHTGAPQWGAGKVLEVTATMATIDFSDGKNRKIAASHFSTLQPASADSYIPSPDSSLVVKVRRTATKKKATPLSLSLLHSET
jgi:hypothetical protein